VELALLDQLVKDQSPVPSSLDMADHGVVLVLVPSYRQVAVAGVPENPLRDDLSTSSDRFPFMQLFDDPVAVHRADPAALARGQHA